MGESASPGGGKLSFLDSLGRVFSGKHEAPGSEGWQVDAGFARLQADFEAAIRGLEQRAEEERRAARLIAANVDPSAMSAEQRVAEKQRRMAAFHRSIGEDIEKMHGRLRTRISGDDVAAIVAFLVDLDAAADVGRNSQELIPRAHHAIAQRLCAEAGALAVARLGALLEAEAIEWPDSTHHHPAATREEVERSRRRRRSEVRVAFLSLDLTHTAERLLGVVRGWGGDYPNRGSPLWEETVLEGVAAGIRGQLIQDFVHALQTDRELLLFRIQESIGAQIATLHQALESGICSAAQAKQVVWRSRHVVDTAVPDIAWEIVQRRLPQARGEFP